MWEGWGSRSKVFYVFETARLVKHSISVLTVYVARNIDIEAEGVVGDSSRCNDIILH